MSDRSSDGAAVGADVPADAEGGTSDKLEKPKPKRKIIRVLTVMAYVLSVSLAAIMLSLYYVFLWDPKSPGGPRTSRRIADPFNYSQFYSNITSEGDTAGSLQPAYQHLPLSSYNLSQSVSPTMETPVDGTPRS
ncbi:putative transmembrane protein INAFM2 isoform X2 [Anabrus simplex]|uniref:putative transmembrane protein INAFM2 isoform X2 n=1 Tax=Anabrus simplex TaxID=316456 RepID=UPI0034DD6497